MAKKITFPDKAFWITESDDNPNHVACLQVLELPDNAKQGYVEEIYQQLRSFDQALSPFNQIVTQFLGFPVRFKTVTELDMDYHVHYHQIDDVADRSSLHLFAASLHEPRLDKKKPLWQFHVIDSKQGNQFAVYIKVHHMLGDGATMVRWFQASYRDTPDTESFTPIWASDLTSKRRSKTAKKQNPLVKVWDFLMATKDLLWIFCRVIFKLLYLNRVYMPVPFTGTKTVLTGQVKRGRVVATLDIDFARLQALSRRLRASVNEILLCCFDIGVHRFLQDYGQTFERALFTHMPINLRKPGDESGGNKIAIVPVELAHGKKDPYLRLRQIIFNHRLVKNTAKRSRPGAFIYYTIVIQSFALLYEVLKVSEWLRPIANILISNVPGPKTEHYFKDAKLKAMYPISAIVPGGGVNITLLTYAGKANIGLVASNNKMKSLEPMALYFAEAFELLEQCIENPELDIDDIGEIVIQDHKSIVLDPHFDLITNDPTLDKSDTSDAQIAQQTEPSDSKIVNQ